MRHAREDYNQIQDGSGKIPQDEPVFLVRGQDPIGPELLRTYARRLKRLKGKKSMVKLIKKWAKEMELWQQNMSQGPHVPDLPDLLKS